MEFKLPNGVSLEDVLQASKWVTEQYAEFMKLPTNKARNAEEKKVASTKAYVLHLNGNLGFYGEDVRMALQAQLKKMKG